MTAFTDYITANLDRLELGTFAITRAHAAHHPEVFEVRRNYETIRDHVAASHGAQPQVGEELAQISRLTGGYAIPDDACMTLEGTYRMLQEAHRLYEAEAEGGPGAEGARAAGADAASVDAAACAHDAESAADADAARVQ